MTEPANVPKKLTSWIPGSSVRLKLIISHVAAVLMACAVFGCMILFATAQDVSVSKPLQASWFGIALVALFLSLAAAIGVSVLTAAHWKGQISSIKDAIDSVVSANQFVEASVLTRDELGEIAATWNAACTKLTNTCRMFDQDQQNLHLVSDVSGVVRTGAYQPANATGGFANTNVHDAALAMSTSAHEIRVSAESLSKETESHVVQIIDTSSAVSEMVESIRQVAENTSKSAAVAEEARANTKRGANAVADTIRGMDRIRSRVQSTSKRIKQLGESSQQIGEIVQLISDVADRTSILAMNATIQAGMAGDAGRGFAVVGEEVERLAKRCNQAIKEIGEIVRCIQSETAEATYAMEESIVEVVTGSKLATQAGEALSDIDSVSESLAELINSISFSAKQQARGGLLVSRSVTEMSEFMQATAAGTRQAAESVGLLAGLADSLRISVATSNAQPTRLSELEVATT